MHSGGSHTTHITGSNAVDGDRAADKPASSQMQGPVAYSNHFKVTEREWRLSILGPLHLQSFQNTRHGQADPDRFSGSDDHSVHEVTNELSV